MPKELILHTYALICAGKNVQKNKDFKLDKIKIKDKTKKISEFNWLKVYPKAYHFHPVVHRLCPHTMHGNH